MRKEGRNKNVITLKHKHREFTKDIIKLIFGFSQVSNVVALYKFLRKWVIPHVDRAVGHVDYVEAVMKDEN